MRGILLIGVALFACFGCRRTQKEESAVKLEKLGAVALSGDVDGAKDLSGIGFVGRHMVLISNETAHVEVLKEHGGGYTVASPVVLEKRKPGEKNELDLEGLATDGDTVYVVGSHSRTRAKTGEVVAEPHRDQLFRFKLSTDGTATDLARVSLRPAIEGHAALKPFAARPGKEGGVNLEGLAARDGKLFVGFRSPVLAGDAVPVLVTTFDRPETSELRLVHLGGRGVRDMVAVQGGLLVLAGPTDGAVHDFHLYLWDGNDCGAGAIPAGKCEPLCKVPHGDKEKPEGLALVQEDATAYELVIVCDGTKSGSPTRYRLKK